MLRHYICLRSETNPRMKLECGCCDCRLGEVGQTFYTKGNLLLCKRDYLRSDNIFIVFSFYINFWDQLFIFGLGCLVLQDTVPLVRKLFRLLRWWWELERMFIIWNVLLVKNVDIDFVSEISSFFMTTRFFVDLIMRRDWSLLHFQVILQPRWQLSKTMIKNIFL